MKRHLQAAGALLLLALIPGTAALAAAPGEGKRHEIPLEGSPSLGPDDAPVTIVEFLDFQ